MKEQPTQKQKKVVKVQWIIAALLVIIIGFVSLIGYITDFLWFKELGYVSVFFKKLVTVLEIGIPAFVVITLLSYVYLKMIKKNYYKKVASSGETDNDKRINLITWGISGVVGVITSVVFTSNLWFEVLRMLNSTDFGIKDPIFNIDISFYVFKLDFLSRLNGLLIGFIVIFLVMTFIYYLILMSMRKPQFFSKGTSDFNEGAEEEERFQGGDFSSKGASMFGDSPLAGVFSKFEEAFKPKGAGKKPAGGGFKIENDNIRELLSIAKTQLVIVGALLFLMVGINFLLRQFTLLYTATGTVYGAGFTDVNITLWIYRILMGLALVGIVTVAIGAKKNNFKIIAIIPILMVAVGLVGAGASLVVQNFIVSPDELNKESKYLERNIEYTQYAYGLNNVTEKPFEANSSLTKQDIKNNEATIKNIRINDYLPAGQFYNQTQSIRQYYTFNDVDVDRYTINDAYTQTFVSAREIDETKISDTWLNKHLKYTHGYGIALSRVNEVTASGQPQMVVDSIPPQSKAKEIDIKRPEIYFGELTNNYTVVGTDEDEFDYPDGDSNKYTRYEGSAGIKLSPINRLMFAIKEKSLKLLVSSNIDSKSKIMINRNIVQRVKKVMPFISYETDPYVVTIEGKLYWIIEGYTSTNKYPYSEPYDKRNNANYIRNSVKVVVDAYNGDTTYYVVDEKDPIAQTMQKIYPKLFVGMDKMPAEIKAHLRYPTEMLTIQAEIYKRYHMEDVKVFYQNEDMWDIAQEIYGTKAATMEPNYYILNLPGETDAEFVSSIPFTPKDKRNMTGLLMVRNDGENYGEVILFKLPKGKTIPGPMQIEAQIDQNTEISKEFSLWQSSGSSYTRGNMFVIPVENSLLYVEPVYLEATNASIPEVKRVIVAYGDRIAYEGTLTEALNSLFGEGSSTEVTQGGATAGDSGSLSQEELIKKASEAFAKAQEAQKAGDWAKYGDYMNSVEKYLEQLKK